MSDIKDILGVARGGGDGDMGVEGGKKPKKAKVEKPKVEKIKRPEGMSREAFALLGGSHPIVTSQLVALTGGGAKAKAAAEAKAKPKPSTKGIPTWQFKSFKNSARSDGLELLRWAKGFKDASGRVREEEDADYFFAKFNKKNQVYRYTDEEYDELFDGASGNWTREETDYLMDLVEMFDSRFVLVADRYQFPRGPSRTIEDLKERYYGIARALLEERGERSHQLVKQVFNKAAERERKNALQTLLTKTEQQSKEDEAFVSEQKAIEERRRSEAAEEKRKADSEAKKQREAAAAAERVRKAELERERLERQAAAAAAAAAAGPAATPPGGFGGDAGAYGGGGGGGGGYAASAPQAGSAYDYPPGSVSDLRHPVAWPNDPGPGVASLFDANIQPAKPPRPGAYAPQHLHNSHRSRHHSVHKVVKAVDDTMIQLRCGIFGRPKVYTRSVAGAWLALTSEVVAMQEARSRMTGGKGTKRARGS